MARPIRCYWCGARKHCKRPKCRAIAGVYRYAADVMRARERNADTWEDNAVWVRRRFAVLRYLENLRMEG